MIDVYVAADKVITELREKVRKNLSVDKLEIKKLVEGAYLLFCTLSAPNMLNDLKCKITQLLVECQQHSLLGEQEFRNLYNNVGIAARMAAEDMNMPMSVAILVSQLMNYNKVQSISYDSLKELPAMITLFSLPALLQAYSTEHSFKQYVYKMICIAYDDSAEGAVASSSDLRTALRLGTLAGVYNSSDENELIGIIGDRTLFLQTCKERIFGEQQVEGTSVFGGD